MTEIGFVHIDSDEYNLDLPITEYGIPPGLELGSIFVGLRVPVLLWGGRVPGCQRFKGDRVQHTRCLNAGIAYHEGPTTMFTHVLGKSRNTPFTEGGLPHRIKCKGIRFVFTLLKVQARPEKSSWPVVMNALNPMSTFRLTPLTYRDASEPRKARLMAISRGVAIVPPI